ncbi:hypothetical protein DM860_005117 [Cuscuta australis]|uniref:Vacuolar ATPase assembly protein VMA22 n=1 Tax=Cuscuta australis TaxID=267555 RepID=A0A328DQ93_9ASTE|nr:hypothetical protein DM860_005117 [Cuscuta australis]
MPVMAEEAETSISADTDDGIPEKDAKVLQFLDSLDSYLTLMDKLSSTLRQGNLELSSARLSMGTSRINSTLLDLKPHSAATGLDVKHVEGSGDGHVCFKLCKWAYSASPESPSIKSKLVEDDLLHETQEKKQENNGSSCALDDMAKRERSKSLSMFGMLVSPKLRAAQLSYETALDTIIEIANTRLSLLQAYNQVAEEIKITPKD